MFERKQREQGDAEHGDRYQHLEQREAGPPGGRDFSCRGRASCEDLWPQAHWLFASAVTGGTSPLTMLTLPVSGLRLSVMTWPETLARWITVAST